MEDAMDHELVVVLTAAVGDRPAKVIAMYAPACFERFLEEAGVPAVGASPSTPPAQADLDRIFAIGKPYGIESEKCLTTSNT
jgi:hypothetical protein